MEDRIKESYYWQQADKKVIKAATMREKGKARFLRHNSREYCSANQSVYCTEQGGGGCILEQPLWCKKELKTQKYIYRKAYFATFKTPSSSQNCLNHMQTPTIQGVFKKHLRGCHTAQCFQFHLARRTKVQVLSSWLFCIWKTATADCNR